jgi:YVTN family beta-propeller protein
MRYGVLGPLQVWTNGAEGELGAGRQRALLALLLLHPNEPVSMDRIIDGLWSGEPPATAAKVVQGYVSQLRKALGDEALATRPPGYELRVGVEEIDSDRFERLVARASTEPPAEAASTLREALALWRGPPLSGFEYDAFAQAEIARLDELRWTAIEDRIDADLAVGGAARLISELEGHVREQPLRERLRGQLMLALYRAGRQPEALAVYNDFRRRLVSELGLEPSSELQQLQRRILAGHAELGRVRRTPLAVAGSRRRLFVIAGAIVVTAAAAVAVALLVSRHSSPIAVHANEVVAIDPRTNRVVAGVDVGKTPTRVVVGGGAVWVINGDDRTMSRIDPRARDVRTISPGSGLADIAFGRGALWAANGRAGTVTRIDPRTARIVDVVRRPIRGSASWFVAADRGSVWISGGTSSTALAWRLDPRTRAPTPRAILREGGYAVALGYGSAWIRTLKGLLRADEQTGSVQARIDLPWNAFVAEDVGGVAVGRDGVWVTSAASHAVWQVDPGESVAVASTDIGATPSGVAIGSGSVWVTNRTDGTVVRIDPVTHDVLKVIHLGQGPGGIAYGFGRIWVSVD